MKIWRKYTFIPFGNFLKRDAALSAILAPIIPSINNTAKRNTASLGKSASITNASSPEVAIIPGDAAAR